MTSFDEIGASVNEAQIAVHWREEESSTLRPGS